MKNFVNYIIIFFGVFGIIIPEAQAVRSIENDIDFERAISTDLVFAHIYFKGKAEDKDVEFKAQYNFASDLFDDLEKQYSDIVTFIKVNAEREQLEDIGEEYADDRYPMFSLFRFGEEEAKIHIPYSKMSTKKLRDFLLDNFGTLIKKKARRLEKEARQRAASVGVSFSFGYGGYYPYDAYDYGYYPYGYYGNYYPYGWSYPGRGYYYAPVRRGVRYRRSRGYRR